MYAILSTIVMILELYKWVLIAMIIMSWLFTFNVINARNQFVAMVWRVLDALTEPVLRPIRNLLPSMGGMDLSPIIVFIIIFFLQSFIAQDLPRLIGLY
ncbi:YggT family protein [Mariluticola halotolerans]|uniref:YggT family protein n=1 Tax=Mariluticola halotolerans TaxID=2909283 RepID=UPI0026E185DA|nr:YggT family protein [Mariluticola halotolerans]UJQ93618.1 YggT family protein [Mariluticola halotolerans]